MSPAARPARLEAAGLTEAGLTEAGLTEAGLTEAGLVDVGRTRTGTAGGPHPAGRADELAGLLAAHVDRLNQALPALQAAAPTLARWGEELGQRLLAGNRLLAAGNGGSAAEAQHLTAELVGRFDGDRRPLSAIALHADTSSLSAIGNDYGFAQVYARQVRAHARPGDVLLMFSTSGRSENLVEAATAAAALDVTSWAVTGPGPNPLAAACVDAVCLPLPGDTATVQEMHLAALHMLCRAVERVVADAPPEPGERVPVERPPRRLVARSCTRARAGAHGTPCARAGGVCTTGCDVHRRAALCTGGASGCTGEASGCTAARALGRVPVHTAHPVHEPAAVCTNA